MIPLVARFPFNFTELHASTLYFLREFYSYPVLCARFGDVVLSETRNVREIFCVTKGLVQSTFGPELHLRWFVNGDVFFFVLTLQFFEFYGRPML